jgi:SPP1 gp7 family putative phage head morphogenesis protein
MALSKTDPTKSKKRIDRYERRLVALFKPFRVRLREFVMVDGRHLESPVQGMIDLNAYKKRLGDLISDSLTGPAGRVIQEEIPVNYKAGVSFGSHMIQQPVTGRIDEMTRIMQLIDRNNQAFAGVTDEMSKQIMQVVSDGIIKGAANYQIVDEILKIEDTIGVSRARTIARTETMTAVNAGVRDRYRAAGVETVGWISAQDDHSCEECDGLDGQQWPIDDAPQPPLHPNCRCTLRAVVLKPANVNDMLKV